MVIVAMAQKLVDECRVAADYVLRMVLSTGTGREMPVFTGFYEVFARDTALEAVRTL